MSKPPPLTSLLDPFLYTESRCFFRFVKASEHTDALHGDAQQSPPAAIEVTTAALVPSLSVPGVAFRYQK